MHSPLEGSIKASIPLNKWQRIIQDNLELSIVLEIRDEILNQMESICYEKYIENQVKNFIIHCSYLGWCDIINVYFLKRDPGEGGNILEKAEWQPDEEPVPSIVDPWSEQTIPIMDNILEQELPPSPSLHKSSLIAPTESLFSQLEEASGIFPRRSASGDSNEIYYEKSITSEAKSGASSLSLFTGSEPAPYTWVLQRKLEMEQMKRNMDLTTECLMNWRKKRYIPGEVVPLQVLSASKLPNRWVDIKCTIVPATPYQSTKKKSVSRRPVVISIK